ncbi:major facilitator superfamily transporter [Niveomyces insectorum RCEF 264]|uniref:Major facilitator superfamily transporter n=1 Tax=Niveomyces insectorum RCEF 264 TaxID=1081102 RepID=A0A167T9F1_9HYPO|nr:major facilitator superfamily transporter [Niveomyces insectorum RCEF 264]
MADVFEKRSKNDPVVETSYALSREEDSEAEQFNSKRTWRSYFWSSLDVSKEEAFFLTKLDLTLISASALGVMCRYIDQVNITNAFNSGMKEDLSLYGNQLNYANAVWSVAYVFGQVPSNLLLTRVNVPLYIAFMELAWSAFTFAHAGVRNVNELYVFRFFVGLFEAGHFPAVMYVCSSYYKPHELARRNSLIQIFTSVGPLFSGFLMAAVYAGLNGVNGLPGWRWMYMIFTDAEVKMARARMPSERKPLTGLFKWKDIKRWHSTWHVYLYLTALAGTSAGITWTWVNEVSRDDPEKRAYISAMMNAFAYIFTAWVPIFTFPTSKQPYIVAGNYITAGFGAAGALTVLTMRYLHNRDLKIKRAQRESL